ncbi:MAG: type II secretion system F family protein [Chloroflexota bacterium]|nr:type II secretion system F family protein [Chloroflexota bacterium]
MLTEFAGLVSPFLFAALVALAVVLVWMAFAPARPPRQVEERLEDYLDRADMVLEGEMSQPFVSRVILPPARSGLSLLGRILPQGSIPAIQHQLVMAGNPGSMTALDFMGLRVLVALLMAVGAFLLVNRNQGFTRSLLFSLAMAVMGYLLVTYWLKRRVRKRQYQIQRALPDALDMLTIGVEAGLAFESALLRVGERWDNPLTQEFRRAVAEMRMGTSRNVALQRMVERTGVQDLRTFVAVLIQSSTLGVSIAEVLHTQAAQMRVKRRQRAEELARQAGVKMVIPLALFIFPAMLVVILGPTIPAFIDLFRTLGGG